jgi:hypothetical protein
MRDNGCRTAWSGLIDRSLVTELIRSGYEGLLMRERKVILLRQIYCIVLFHLLSFNMESPRESATKKRLACDRCHARKLRCSRDPTGCLRCIRDGSTCIYSPALKVGRPSKASMAAKDIQSDPSRRISDAALFALPDTQSVSTDSGISVPTPHSHLRGDMVPGS